MPAVRQLLAISLFLVSTLPLSQAQSSAPAPVTFIFGSIEFFGTGEIDLSRLRSELPLHAGDSLTEPEIPVRLDRLKQKLKRLTGRTPTDTALVCCDANKKWILYLGLGFGKQPVPYPYRRRSGTERLPTSALDLYRDEMAALNSAVRSGDAEEGRLRRIHPHQRSRDARPAT